MKTKEARLFVSEVLAKARAMGLNCFVVTDGASGVTNLGNEAVRSAREAHEKWELEHGYNPDEDWSK